MSDSVAAILREFSKQGETRGLVTLSELKRGLQLVAAGLAEILERRDAATEPQRVTPVGLADVPAGMKSSPKPCPICATPFRPKWRKGGTYTETCSPRHGAALRARKKGGLAA